MKRLVTICILLLLSTVAFAQDDCYAPYCGSIPLMHFNNQGGGVTDLFLYYDSDCDIYFRTRFSPTEGHAPSANIYQLGDGEDRFIIKDIMGRWLDYGGVGTFILDWATYECEPIVLAAGIYRTEPDPYSCGPLFYNINQADKYEPGCYLFYQSSTGSHEFHIYNESSTDIQTVKYEGVFHLAMPGETLSLVSPEPDVFFEICIGEELPGPSVPGLDLDLHLYIEGLSTGIDGDKHKIIHLK